MSDLLALLMEAAKLGSGLLAENTQLRTENEKLKAQVAAHDAALKPAPPPAEPPPAPPPGKET